MSERLIFGLTGGPGTGKSTNAEYLRGRHGFVPFEGSRILREEAAKDDKQLEQRSDYDAYYRACQLRRGLPWLSERAIHSAFARVSHVGLRDMSDAINILESGGIIIALSCPNEIAFNRIDKEDPKYQPTFKAFTEANKIHDSEGILGSHQTWVTNHATYTIDTSQPLFMVHHELDTIVADRLAGRSDI